MRRIHRSVLAALVLAGSLAPAATAVKSDKADKPTSESPDCNDWSMYGRTLTRTFAACESKVDATTVATLVPAWTFRPPELINLEDQLTFTASPTVADGTVYIGGWDGFMYALDQATGTMKWRFHVPDAPGATFGPIVSTAAVAEGSNGTPLVIFGAGPRIFALRASDGSVAWQHYVGALTSGAPTDPDAVPALADDPAEVESSPVVWNNVVYVGMDVHDQVTSRTAGVRGGLLALNLQDGTLKWKWEAERYGRGLTLLPEPVDGGCGGVWSSPTVDVERKQIYVATANCYTARADNQIPLEEVAALRPSDGTPIWRFFPHQPGENHDLQPGAERNDDVDFGATPNLFGDVLGAGNKDGRYYVLDPATGKLVRRSNQVSVPGPNVGGFIGSTAISGRNVFGGTAIGAPPSYHSLNVDAKGVTGRPDALVPNPTEPNLESSGMVRWQAPVVPTYGASAVSNDVAFAGALDGILRAFHTDTGAILWASPTLGPISSGPVVVGDMVFVGSGTSTSDLCAKEDPWSPACFLVFDTILGQQGGVHAFRLVTSAIG